MISMVDPTPRFATAEKSRDGAGPSYNPTDTHYAPGLAAARGMGWFGIGLGVAELLTPGLVSALTGVQNKRLLQLWGLREIATGVGVLNSPQPANWMWARVVGDILDFGTVVEALISAPEHKKDEAAIALVGVVGAAFADAAAAMSLSAAAAAEKKSIY